MIIGNPEKEQWVRHGLAEQDLPGPAQCRSAVAGLAFTFPRADLHSTINLFASVFISVSQRKQRRAGSIFYALSTVRFFVGFFLTWKATKRNF